MSSSLKQRYVSLVFSAGSFCCSAWLFGQSRYLRANEAHDLVVFITGLIIKNLVVGLGMPKIIVD